MSGHEVLVHRPGPGVPQVRSYLREAWRRRALAWHLARSRADAERSDSLLGRLWTVLNPLLLAGVYLVLITVLTGHGGSQRLLIVLLGLFWFTTVRLSALQGARAITDNVGLVLNASFPRLLLVAAAVLSALRAVLPSLAVYAAIHLLLGRPARIAWTLLPPLLLLTALLCTGVAAALAVATVAARDVTTVLPYLLRVTVYLTPVLYRTEEIPEALRPWLWLNPLTPLFDAVQVAVLDGDIAWGSLGRAAVSAVVVAIVGVGVFLRAERGIGARI